MDVGGYRHNYKGFYEKSTYEMSINRGRMTRTQGAYASLMKFSHFFSFSLDEKL